MTAEGNSGKPAYSGISEIWRIGDLNTVPKPAKELEFASPALDTDDDGIVCAKRPEIQLRGVTS